MPLSLEAAPPHSSVWASSGLLWKPGTSFHTAGDLNCIIFFFFMERRVVGTLACVCALIETTISELAGGCLSVCVTGKPERELLFSGPYL